MASQLSQGKLNRLACSVWVVKKHFHTWVLTRWSLGTRFIWEVHLNPVQIAAVGASHSSRYGSAWLWLKISITCKIDGVFSLFLNCNYIQNLAGRYLDFNNPLPLYGESVNQFSPNISHTLDIKNWVTVGLLQSLQKPKSLQKSCEHEDQEGIR